VWIIGVGGSGERAYARTDVGGEDLFWARDWSILYQRPGNRNFNVLNPQTEAERPLVTNDSIGWMFSPVVSPDGRYVAVDWNRRNGGVYLISLRDSSQRLLLGGRRLYPIGWSADSRRVYLDSHADSLIVVPIGGAARGRTIRLPFKPAKCTASEQSDGLRLVCAVSEHLSDIWTIEDFDPGGH
jgi:hypothetical protein